MKRSHLITIVALLLIALPASAQDDKTAEDLDELLKMVEEGRSRDEGAQRERETAFRAARDQQAQMLTDARRQSRDAERRSEELENLYNQNDLRIVEVTEQLDRRMGSLKELFGVMQQVTGDTRAFLEISVISAQYPGRTEFLSELNAKLASQAVLPSIEDIERLWFLMQQEMTETGKIVKFPATVIAKDGREIQEDVVRVGGFNLVTQGKYLQLHP